MYTMLLRWTPKKDPRVYTSLGWREDKATPSAYVLKRLALFCGSVQSRLTGFEISKGM